MSETRIEQTDQPGKAALIVGWVLTVLIAAGLTFSGVLKLMGRDDVKTEFARLGLPDNMLFPLGILELACLAVFLIPQTAVLGAILLAGYFGGAICTHWRAGDPIGNMVPPIIMGVMAWLAVYLRDPRVRKVVPLR
jgi:uncharacterized membrane protein YphA (DoxX/SURF4 family)